MRRFKKILLCWGIMALGSSVFAQQYPERPIRLIVPYTTGGGTDLLARIVGQELSNSLGQSVVVDNKPGAGAVIGTDIVAKARPDGYTLALISSGHAMNPWLYSKLPFDSVADISPVIQIASGPNVIAVNADVPARTVAELIAMLRKEPGRYSFGSAGIGNPTHLAGEIFQSATQTKLIHVPYKGSGQAEVGLAGGEVTMIVDSIPAALPFIKSGKTRALAVTGARRFPLLPDTPTADEAGLRDFDLSTWWGIVAPPNTPAPIIAKLNESVARALQSPEVRGQFLRLGAEPTSSTARQFGDRIRSETERYGKIIRDLGIRPQP